MAISSSPDTDPYEPQPGGCCSLLPFHNRGIVELPITLPQDHTLFVILQHADAGLWLRKAGHIRDRGGMVLVVTHPDYAHDQRLANGYQTLLDTFAADATAWRALPREVAALWRQRGRLRINYDAACELLDRRSGSIQPFSDGRRVRRPR